MNTLLLSIILVPIVEIYLFIKIGSHIGAFTTITLIFVTAIIGVYYAKYEGCLLYTSPSPRDGLLSRMPSSA